MQHPRNLTNITTPQQPSIIQTMEKQAKKLPASQVCRSFTGQVSFSASKGTVSPSMSGAFTEGTWRGLINMSEAGFDIVVYVNDGNGHTGRSKPISVYPQNPTPTPMPSSSSTNPTPTPAVPEFSWLAIISLFAFVLSTTIILRHRKTLRLNQ